jgi:hypothetical protein
LILAVALAKAGEFPRAPAASIGRLDDAQGQAGHGRFLLLLFSFSRKKMKKSFQKMY